MTKRITAYACPICRVWRACATEMIRLQCSDRDCCQTCAATGAYRLRCHIARIEESIMDPDGRAGGRIATAARLLPPEQRGIYRQLVQKRRRQLAAAQELLQTVTRKKVFA